MTADITQDLQQWALYLRDTMPSAEVRVTHYEAEDGNLAIDIFSSLFADRSIAATLGLMTQDQSQDPGWQLFTELLMDGRGAQPAMGEMLSAIALTVLGQRIKIAPGVVFDEMLEFFLPGRAVRHILFTDPLQWEQELSKVILETKTIYPLLALPITDGENAYLELHGLDALEERWKSLGCDLLDWTRKDVF